MCCINCISMMVSDTKHERNALMEKAYPKLKSFCKQLGYEFQVGWHEGWKMLSIMDNVMF